MRVLLRIVITWIVLMPLAAYVGFPYLLTYLEGQTKKEAHRECLKQTATQPSVFDPALPEIAGKYCACVRDGVVMSRADLIALLRRQPATAMNDALQQNVTRCSERLASPGPADAQVIQFQ